MSALEDEYQKFLKSSELFREEKGADEIYNFNRNCIHRLDILKYCERMWKQFRSYSGDENFVREFRDKFRQKWWELFLADSFLRNGLILDGVRGEGPDFKIKNQEQTIWVEAISMTNGEEDASDSVPAVVYRQAQTVPTEKILLRITSGFKEKSDKFKKYLEKKIVNENDQFIIAIDISGISHAIVADKEEMPLSCKALLGIGELTMSIPVVKGKGKTKTFYGKREKIEKTHGKPVPATGLLMDGFDHISGVLTNVRSFTETEQRPNSLRLLSNPMAKNKLDIQFWKFVRDIYFESDGYLNKK